jgi:hypothetical protein
MLVDGKKEYLLIVLQKFKLQIILLSDSFVFYVE